eukprot:548242-Pelagomonas_calceolata.AAC.1
MQNGAQRVKKQLSLAARTSVETVEENMRACPGRDHLALVGKPPTSIDMQRPHNAFHPFTPGFQSAKCTRSIHVTKQHMDAFPAGLSPLLLLHLWLTWALMRYSPYRRFSPLDGLRVKHTPAKARTTTTEHA